MKLLYRLIADLQLAGGILTLVYAFLLGTNDSNDYHVYNQQTVLLLVGSGLIGIGYFMIWSAKKGR